MRLKTAQKVLKSFASGKYVDADTLALAMTDAVTLRSYTKRSSQDTIDAIRSAVTQEYVDALVSKRMFGSTIGQIFGLSGMMSSEYGYYESEACTAFANSLTKINVVDALAKEDSLKSTIDTLERINLVSARELLGQLYDQGTYKHFDAPSIRVQIASLAAMANSNPHWHEVAELSINSDAVEILADDDELFSTIARLSEMKSGAGQDAILKLFEYGAGPILQSEGRLEHTVELLVERASGNANTYLSQLFKQLSADNLGFAVSATIDIGNVQLAQGFHLEPNEDQSKGKLIAVAVDKNVFSGPDPIRKAKIYFGLEKSELLPPELIKLRKSPNLPEIKDRIANGIDKLAVHRSSLVR